MEVEIIGHVQVVDPNAPEAWSHPLPDTDEQVYLARRVKDLVAAHGWTFPLSAEFDLSEPVLISLEEFRGRDIDNIWVVLGWEERALEV